MLILKPNLSISHGTGFNPINIIGVTHPTSVIEGTITSEFFSKSRALKQQIKHLFLS